MPFELADPSAAAALVPVLDAPARDVLAEAVAGMADAAGTSSPALRPRSVGQQLARLVRRGPVGSRRLP